MQIAARSCARLLAAIATLLPAARATDIVVKNDSLAGVAQAALQEGFIVNETGAAVLAAPGQYPLTMKDVQVMVLKDNLFANTTMTAKVYIWSTATISGSSPSLASAIYVSPTVTMTAGGFNILNTTLDPNLGNVVVNGPFTVGCQIISTGGIPGFISSPSLVTDTDGCQSGKSWVRQTNGVWLELCSQGVSGDLAIRVTASTNNNGQFIVLGNAKAGNFAPALAGSGSLAGGGNFTLSFTNLPPSTAGVLFTGLTQINANFKGGVLVPQPTIVINLPTGPGSLNLPASMPNGLPSNFALYMHGWFPDAGATFNADATNALKLITP